MAWGLEAHREDLEDRDQPDEPLLLQHPFTTQQLPRALLTQLLDKASDPHLGTLSPEDCELEVKQGLEGWLHPPGWKGPAGGVSRNRWTCGVPAQSCSLVEPTRHESLEWVLPHCTPSGPSQP